MFPKVFAAVLIIFSSHTIAKANVEADTTSPPPPSCDVQQAVEGESLFPMFFTGGYHACAAYRYKDFRVRVSVINGGTYDAEPAGITNAKGSFKRYYKTSPGLFLGYNIWKNLEIYTFFEGHTFQIEHKSTGLKKEIKSLDVGGGISYQFFIGRIFYVQPGIHLYLRERRSVQFANEAYRIPAADLAPVIRIGFRLWERY
jgi:hypothetical protein